MYISLTETCSDGLPKIIVAMKKQISKLNQEISQDPWLTGYQNHYLLVCWRVNNRIPESSLEVKFYPFCTSL